MKYKVGDSVISMAGETKKVRQTVYNPPYGVYFMDDGAMWTEDFIERKIDMFTKKDLKDGMIVKYRNGTMRIVEGDKLLYPVSRDEAHNLCYYQNNLMNANHHTDEDIIAVYEVREPKLVWERTEPRKVTASEIFEAFKDEIRAKFGEDVVLEENK